MKQTFIRVYQPKVDQWHAVSVIELTSNVNEVKESELAEAVFNGFVSGANNLVLDARGFRFLGSSVYSLVGIDNTVTERGGKMSLVGLAQEDYVRLVDARLIAFFGKYPSVWEAVKSFSG